MVTMCIVTSSKVVEERKCFKCCLVGCFVEEVGHCNRAASHTPDLKNLTLYF
nr:TPA_asm: hypothetical protein HUJ06_025501 [Nelumbo nucifera]DAD24039.1 TPA_asm: hypothetical protein HUJ06_025502 [Nelumbo nucifera]